MDTQGKPLWMVFKDQEEKRKREAEAASKAESAAPRPAPLPVVKHAPVTKKTKVPRLPSRSKAVKEPKAPAPDWTVKSWEHEANTIQSRKQDGPIVVVTSYLKYKGRMVHMLKGPMSKKILEEEAAVYNERGYTPSTERVRAYCELSDDERLALANKHSPELKFE